MWTRRRFLESASALPGIGGSLGGQIAGVPPSALGYGAAFGRDYFAELGVRPFINAAGTYTAMTGSLMPPRSHRRHQYASSTT